MLTILENSPKNVSEKPGAVPLSHKHIGAEAFVGTFGTSVFVQGCLVLQGIILARFLGPTGRGNYAAIILWPTIFAYIGLFGTSFSIARLAAKEEDVGSVLRSGLLLAVLTSLVTASIGYFLLPFLIPAEKHQILPLARFFLLYIPVCQMASNLAAIDQGSGNFFRLNFLRALQSPFFIACLTIIFVLNLNGLIWFVFAFLVAQTIAVLSRMILLIRDYGIRGRMYSVMKILRGGGSFGLAVIGVQIYTYTDRILLLWLLEPRYMGLYVVALSASSVIRSITTSMGLVSFTITAQAARAEGFERVGSIFRKAVVMKFLGGSVLVFAVPFLLPLVYGDRFGDAVRPAIVLIVGSAFAGLALLLDQCMRGQGKPFAGLASRIAAIITMVAVGFPASRAWGTIGVAAAFVAAQFVCLCMLTLQVLFYYNDAKLSNFVPKLADVTELLGVVKRTLRKLNLGKYGRWIGLGDDSDV